MPLYSSNKLRIVFERLPILNDVVLLLLGLFGGLALSFALWWWLNHKLVPDITFSEELSSRPIDYDDQGSRCQIAIKNNGSRSAIDVRIKADLVITDALGRGNSLKNFLSLELNGDEVFELGSQVARKYTFMPHESEALTSKIVCERLRKRLEDKTLVLEDIFHEYENCYVQVSVIATDIYSRATRVFVSRKYFSRDVRQGVFIGHDLRIYPLGHPGGPATANGEL